MNIKSGGESSGAAHNPREDVLRAARLCHPGWESMGRLTFEPRRESIPWQSWKREIFGACLRPQMEAILLACEALNGREMEAGDRVIETRLSPCIAAISRSAGAHLAGGFTVPNGEKFWRRAKDLVVSGAIPGHLVTVMALRAAAFHLPPPLVVASYVLMEAHGAFGAGEMRLCFEMVDDCLAEKTGAFVLRAA